ncbi:MAG: penicillin-binding protein [Spirochaetota bacterium]
MTEIPKARGRIYIVAVFLSLIVIGVAAQYGRIMLFGPDSDSVSEESSPVIERGAILDRNGEILAIQTRLHTVSAWLPHVTNPEESADLLAEILDLPESQILDRLTGSRNYVYIQRLVSPRASDAIERLKDEGELEGISLEPSSGRTYPSGSLASHVIGHVGIDNRGLDGLEYSYDSLLSPEDGRVRGDTLYGNQLVLTIDANIQAVTDRLSRETYERENAESVMLLAMDADNGEILSWSSIPSYNPNNFADSPREERRNRPIRFMYEPGSVFKMFTVAVMMQHGAAADGDTFETDGTYRPDSWGDARPITDIRNYGTMDLRRVIERSSNVGVAYASEEISEQDLYQGLNRFGFGQPTGIPLAGEQAGILNPPERWSYRSKPTISMGQEIGVTALQMLTAATAFANDGIRLEPALVRQVVSPSGEVLERHERTPEQEVISPSVARTMLDYMRTATHEGGTGRLANVEGISISAKTGTAEFFDLGRGEYSDEKFVGSTLALFPSEDPEIILYMVVEDPRGEYIWGERVAAPVIRETAEFLVQYMGIERESDEYIRRTADLQLENARTIEVGEDLPDLQGLPRRSLLSLYTNEHIELDIRGHGWVVRQDPAAGTPIHDGMQVTVELE